MRCLHVQNSCSPVSRISPLHLGQVCLSQIAMSELPQCRQSRPTSLRQEGATSAMMPPTTMFWIVWHSRQLMAVICCRNNPRPSYASAIQPHWSQRYFFFQDICVKLASRDAMYRVHHLFLLFASYLRRPDVMCLQKQGLRTHSCFSDIHGECPYAVLNS